MPLPSAAGIRVPHARGPGIFRRIATVLAGRGALQSENFNVYLAIVRPLVIVILALALV